MSDEVEPKIPELSETRQKVSLLDANRRIAALESELAKVREKLSVAQRLHVKRDVRDEQDAQARRRLLAERDERQDMANVGEALMETIKRNLSPHWSWNDCPSEVVVDLINERDEARAERDAALAALKDIGDFAHCRSTGPAVPDAMWEIRRMAYDELAARKEEA